MKKIQLKEKYPVFTTEISKKETDFANTDEILSSIKAKIENHPIASYITTFDNLAHTKSLDGHSVVDGLVEAKNIIFCFGKEIPTPKILAVRPRSIGVCEFQDKFEISFLEAPKEALQLVMEKWIEGIKN